MYITNLGFSVKLDTV